MALHIIRHDIAGTPHWFKDVRAPFDYYVVKVR